MWALTPENMSNLLGLYQGLIKYLEVKPKTIHRWRVKGRLIEEIKVTYEKLPLGSDRGYYPWFYRTSGLPIENYLHPRAPPTK